jgi:hypothetical protein
MVAKEYSNSKKEGWEHYKAQTWFLLPRLFNSDLYSYLFYSFATFVSYLVYMNGGVEQTLRWR